MITPSMLERALQNCQNPPQLFIEQRSRHDFQDEGSLAGVIKTLASGPEHLVGKINRLAPEDHSMKPIPTPKPKQPYHPRLKIRRPS